MSGILQSRIVRRLFWDITDECWAAIAARLRPGMDTLETGSGKSTALFERAGCRHIALEHDPAFRPACHVRRPGAACR